MSLFRLFLFLVFLSACAEKTSSESEVSEAEIASLSVDFPKDWKGKWAGELKIFTGEGLKQTLPMELHILPLDSSENWSWTIFYGEDKVAGKRDYILQPKDVEKGIWQVDEQNSILLDAYLFDGKLFERFEVMGNLLTTTTELQGDKLVWEIISGSLTKTTSTGDTVDGTDTIPEVKSYPINVMQRAVLRRK